MKLSQITTAGSSNIKQYSHNASKTKLLFLDFHRQNFFTYPFHVNKVYICRLVSHLMTKARVERCGLSYAEVYLFFQIKENSEESHYISSWSKFHKKNHGLFMKLWTGEHISYIWPKSITLR